MSTSPALPPILIVDDSDDDLFFFKHLLRKTGVMNPCQAAIGAEPLYALLSAWIDPNTRMERPLVCFVDIGMTGTDGFDIVRWIRSRKALDFLPVVMLSVSDDARDMRKSAKTGAQSYLTKYPSTAVLAEVIADAASFGRSPKAFDKPYNLLLPYLSRK
jgi:CheY-like chemotaxis protein